MAMAGALLGAGITSAIGGGIMQAFAGAREKQFAYMNAIGLERQALDTEYQGKILQRQISYAGRKSRGEAVAGFGKSGVALSGSALDRLSDLDSQVSQDLFMAEYNARNQAVSLRRQAENVRMRGKMAQDAGMISGIFSALGGTAQAGSSYMAYKGD